MGKRAPPLIYNGSMKKYFWGYLNKYHMYINPKDYHAERYALAFSEDVNFGRMKFQNHQSDFDLRLIPIYGKDNHSYVFCSWINKMEKKIYIHHDPKAIEALYAKIKYYNDICEDDRNWDNQDEEPEDEISLLT